MFGRYCFMGHESQVTILTLELPHSGAYVKFRVYPGYPDPQVFVAIHHEIPTGYAIIAELGDKNSFGL